MIESEVIKNGLRSLLTSITKEEAMTKELTMMDLGGQAFQVQVTPKRGRPRSKKTVAEIYDNYKYSAKQKDQSKDLNECEERYFRLHIIPFMGKLFVEDVAGVLQGYVEHREKAGTKPDTLAKETRALKKAINEDDPMWRKPKLRFTNEAKRVELKHRVKDLIPVIEEVKASSKKYGAEYAKMGMVALFTSMRLKDISEINNKALDRVNWKITFIQSKVKNILRARKSHKTSKPITVDVNEQIRDIFNQVPKTKKGYLFDIPHTKAVTTAYRRAFRVCGIEGSFHSFRHACATTLLANGANIKVVQDILGHANINTTMKYVHALDSDKKDAINSIKI